LNRASVEGRLLHDLAEIHHQQGRHRDAVELFEKSYALRRDAGDRFGALTTKHMLVLALRALRGNYHDIAYRKAQEVLAEASELAKEDSVKAPWVAHPIEVLSLFARDRKNFKLEHDLLMEALQIHLTNNQDDRSIMLGQCYGRLGQLSAEQRRYDEAIKYFNESLKYSAEGLNRRVAATSLRYLGDVYVAKKLFGEAIKNYTEAMDIAIDGSFTEEQIALSLSLARLYFLCGQIYDALSELQNILFLRKTLQ
jgi:tetratricopeptide (TPR) repeat protein